MFTPGQVLRAAGAGTRKAMQKLRISKASCSLLALGAVAARIEGHEGVAGSKRGPGRELPQVAVERVLNGERGMRHGCMQERAKVRHVIVDIIGTVDPSLCNRRKCGEPPHVTQTV